MIWIDGVSVSMGQAGASDRWTTDRLLARVVRYADLDPCYNAFIDCRTPGSEAKENFTIIGPGVSENPAQHVHIAEPHGFNIGGARQPPHCVNSQHSHETAEVFLVHSGDWRFDLGEHGDDAQIELHPGDVISLPVRTFRGFTNIGEDTGFLWAVLGNDDPGRVTWAPKVFEMARDYGLVLLENGQLIDTAAGEAVPSDTAAMTPTSPEVASSLQRMTAAQADALVVRDDRASGAPEAGIIGERAPLAWTHGFTLDRIDIAAGGQSARLVTGNRAEVAFVHQGIVVVSGDDGRIVLQPGDTMSLPPNLSCALDAPDGATVFFVRATAP